MNEGIHKDFKLNENSFDSIAELLTFSQSLSFELFSFLSQWFDAADFIIVQTSGSTGKPKIIEVKKQYMVNSARATGRYFRLESETTALLCLSLNHIAGKMMMIRSLILGWHLDIVNPSSNPVMGINRKYDFTAMVPMQLHNSIDYLHRFGSVIVGGAKVSDELKRRLSELSTQIFATYGMTETITHIAVKPLNKVAGLSYNSDCFQALPHVSLNKDRRNCLIIDAPGVSDHPIITNDVVDLLSENKFKWLGRFDHIINSGGVKIIPEQVEEKIEPFLKNRFIVSSLPDAILGNKIVLIIEGEDSNNQSKQILSKILKINTLHKYEIPKAIYFVPKFKLTKTNKVIRKKTKKMIF